MPDTDGNSVQTRKIIQQMLDALEENRPSREPQTPAAVKYIVNTVAALGLAAMLAGGTWLVGSVATMRETLARIDERQVLNARNLDDRFQAIDARLGRLEAQKGYKP